MKYISTQNLHNDQIKQEHFQLTLHHPFHNQFSVTQMTQSNANWYELKRYEYDMDHSDPLTIHNKFIITISYNLDIINIVFMIDNICKVINIYSNITIIGGGAIEVGLFVYVVYFIIQAMDKSLLNVQLSFEFDAIIVAMDQLMSNFAVQSSIAAVCAYTQVLHNVCAVFYSFFSFILFFFFFFLRLYMLYY